MKTKELLLECKIKAKVSSDYALAKSLDIPRQRIADYMSGKMHPDTYAAVKIALCLKRDPAEIIALLESENEKNPRKKAFWLDFLQRVRQAIRSGTLALLCTTLLLFGQSASKPPAAHNV